MIITPSILAHCVCEIGTPGKNDEKKGLKRTETETRLGNYIPCGWRPRNSNGAGFVCRELTFTSMK
jgi:hypothetical protein